MTQNLVLAPFVQWYGTHEQKSSSGCQLSFSHFSPLFPVHRATQCSAPFFLGQNGPTLVLCSESPLPAQRLIVSTWLQRAGTPITQNDSRINPFTGNDLGLGRSLPGTLIQLSALSESVW